MWKDFDIELGKQADGDVKANLGVDAIKGSILNIWKTNQGSRRMIPSFAGENHNIMFEQLDQYTLDHIKSLLLGELERWEDRIVVQNISTEAEPDKNLLIVKLTFSIKGEIEDRIYNVNYDLVAG